MFNRIQRQLIEEFPEFRDRQKMLEYYVSFQFPERQRKMLSWWEEKIETAIRMSRQLYLTPSDLDVIFSIEGLKPIPLPDILEHLSKSNKIEWRDKPFEQKQKKQESGWLGSIVGYMWKTPKDSPGDKIQKRSTILSCTSSKIFPTNYRNQLISKLSKIVKQSLANQGSDSNSIPYETVFNLAQEQIDLSAKSLSQLFAQLQQQQEVYVEEIESKKVLFVNDQHCSIEKSIWLEIQKSKYLLRSKIQYLEKKAELKYSEEQKKMAEAKLACASDRNKARKLLENVAVLRRISGEYNTRIRLLKDTLHQLQIQQADKITLSTLKNSQQVIKKTMIDASQFDQIRELNEEIKFNQSETNKHLESLTFKDSELSEEMQQMMAELEREVNGSKKQAIQKQQVYVDTGKNAKVQQPLIS